MSLHLIKENANVTAISLLFNLYRLTIFEQHTCYYSQLNSMTIPSLGVCSNTTVTALIILCRLTYYKQLSRLCTDNITACHQSCIIFKPRDNWLWSTTGITFKDSTVTHCRCYLTSRSAIQMRFICRERKARLLTQHLKLISQLSVS